MAFASFDRQRASAPMAEINMVPLIDVMLVLLVIFIVTAPLLTHAVKLDLPQGQRAGQRAQAREDRVRDRRRRQRCSGTASRSRATRPRSASPPKASSQPQPEVHLRADQAVRLPLRRPDAGRRLAGRPDQGRLRQRARSALITPPAPAPAAPRQPVHDNAATNATAPDRPSTTLEERLTALLPLGALAAGFGLALGAALAQTARAGRQGHHARAGARCKAPGRDRPARTPCRPPPRASARASRSCATCRSRSPWSPRS